MIIFENIARDNQEEARAFTVNEVKMTADKTESVASTFVNIEERNSPLRPEDDSNVMSDMLSEMYKVHENKESNIMDDEYPIDDSLSVENLFIPNSIGSKHLS